MHQVANGCHLGSRFMNSSIKLLVLFKFNLDLTKCTVLQHYLRGDVKIGWQQL